MVLPVTAPRAPAWCWIPVWAWLAPTSRPFTREADVAPIAAPADAERRRAA